MSEDYNEINTAAEAGEYAGACRERLTALLDQDMESILDEQYGTLSMVQNFIAKQVIGGARSMGVKPPESAQAAVDALTEVLRQVALAKHTANDCMTNIRGSVQELESSLSSIADLAE